MKRAYQVHRDRESRAVRQDDVDDAMRPIEAGLLRVRTGSMGVLRPLPSDGNLSKYLRVCQNLHKPFDAMMVENC